MIMIFFFICFLKLLFFGLCVFKAFSHSLILFGVEIRFRVRVKVRINKLHSDEIMIMISSGQNISYILMRS
jgi:hypothetical protein